MHDVVRKVVSGRLENMFEADDLSSDLSGRAMHHLVSELFPICRSITGNGLRQTLRKIQDYIPLTTCEVPSGLKVFDWTIPAEWNIRDAYIKSSAGDRIVDLRASNLHVVSYSVPVHVRLSLAELKKYLFSDPDHPDCVPYRTSYYSPTWGFCVAHNQLVSLQEDEYEVCIDSVLEPGHLTYGQLRLAGNSADEVLISCHICHPSLANDNLSGIAVAAALAQYLRNRDLRYSYRFLFVPGTIGSIAWLALNQAAIGSIKHGFVLTCVGDAGAPTYKRSRRGEAEIDRAWVYTLQQSGDPFTVVPFSPFGYDERQYCSPGINLSVGCFMRTPHGKFPEYHTSADNVSFVKPAALRDSLDRAIATIDVIENNVTYVNQKPMGEPKLGDYGLYSGIGGTSADDYQMALLWLLNMSDGTASLLDIAERSGLPWDILKQAAVALTSADLLMRQ